MSVQRITLYSSILRLNTELNVILPEGCEHDSSREKYKVLWLFHGANGNCNEWLHYSCILRYASKYRLAVVMPSLYDSFSMNMAHGFRYADFLENELMQTMRRLYPMFSTEQADNFVAGGSMGGYAAVRLAMNCPERFEAAGSFAGAILAGKIYTRYLQGIQPGGVEFNYAFGPKERLFGTKDDIAFTAAKKLAEGAALPRLFMFCGTEDFGYDLNTEGRDALLQAGVKVTWREAPGVHGFDCWDPHVPEFLSWLMPQKGGNTCGDH